MSAWRDGVWAVGALAVGSWVVTASQLAWQDSPTAWESGAWVDFSWRGMQAGETPVIPTDYVNWLKSDNQTRIVLIEAKAYSGSAEVTRYMSSGPFVSEPTDTPANQAYDDLVLNIPQFSMRMSEQFSGQSVAAWGDIDISNENGERDSWLNDGWDGRSLRQYLGSPDWTKAQFSLLNAGVTADIYAKDQDTLSLKARDKQWMLNVPVQTNLIGGTAANKDQPIPLCFGPCPNVEPMLIDSATSEYQVHDGAVQAITAVYDNGVSVAYTANNDAGTFTLSASPSGRITADVQGAKPDGAYLTRCADIVKHLILTRSRMTTADLDTSSFSAFNVICPQTMTLYIRDRQNLQDVIDALVTSVGGWSAATRIGLLKLGRLSNPSGTPVLELDEDDAVQGELRCIRRINPSSTIRIGYRTNWTLQTDGLAGDVSEARRAELATEFGIAKATDSSIQTKHLLAEEPDAQPTLLSSQSDADTEVNRRLSLHGVVRNIYAAEFFAAPFKVAIGDVVKLTHPRFGFESGVRAVVVAVTDYPTKGRVYLELWK